MQRCIDKTLRINKRVKNLKVVRRMKIVQYKKETLSIFYVAISIEEVPLISDINVNCPTCGGNNNSEKGIPGISAIQRYP